MIKVQSLLFAFKSIFAASCKQRTKGSVVINVRNWRMYGKSFCDSRVQEDFYRRGNNKLCNNGGCYNEVIMF
jgi:hypothetical protein